MKAQEMKAKIEAKNAEVQAAMAEQKKTALQMDVLVDEFYELCEQAIQMAKTDKAMRKMLKELNIE